MTDYNEATAINEGNMTSVVQVFRNHFLSAFGIESNKIIEHCPTEIVTLWNEKVLIEDLYEVEGFGMLHLAFQDAKKMESEDVLLSFLGYDLKIKEKFFDHIHLIQTVIVIAGATKETNIVSSLDLGALRYKVETVSLNEIDGDEIYIELRKKSENGYTFTDEELCKLIMLPFLKCSVERSDRAIEALEITNHFSDEEQKATIRSLMLKMADKFEFDDIKRVLEA